MCIDFVNHPSDMPSSDPKEELKNRMMECAEEITLLGHKERENDALVHRMRARGPLKPNEFAEKDWKKHVDSLEELKKKGIKKRRREIKVRMKLLLQVKRGCDRKKG